VPWSAGCPPLCSVALLLLLLLLLLGLAAGFSARTVGVV